MYEALPLKLTCLDVESHVRYDNILPCNALSGITLVCNTSIKSCLLLGLSGLCGLCIYPWYSGGIIFTLLVIRAMATFPPLHPRK